MKEDKSANLQIAKRLYDARKAKGMSRAALGKLVNVHETTVKRYEDGMVDSLDVDKLKEFAKHLGVSAAFLIGWEDENGTKTEEYIEKKNFVTDLLETMISHGMITDPDNIPEPMIKMIVDAVKLEAAKMMKDKN